MNSFTQDYNENLIHLQKTIMKNEFIYKRL